MNQTLDPQYKNYDLYIPDLKEAVLSIGKKTGNRPLTGTGEKVGVACQQGVMASLVGWDMYTRND